MQYRAVGVGPVSLATARPVVALTSTLKRILDGYTLSIVNCAGGMASSDSPASEEGPHQPRSLSFPSRQFGKTKIVSRSFQSKWFDQYQWLHYDEAQDAAYCYTC